MGGPAAPSSVPPIAGGPRWGVANESTRFTELVGCRHPVQLAGMGGAVGGSALALAVQEGGGLGMVGWGEEVPVGCGVNVLVPFMPPPEQIADVARRFKQRSEM